jgi:uncharacterized iron-regulated membrane protein
MLFCLLLWLLLGLDRQLWLQRRRVDAVRVKAFTNRPRLVHEVAHLLVRDNNMRGCDGLFLVKPPNV